MRFLRLLARRSLAPAVLLPSLLGVLDATSLQAAEIAVFLEKDIKIYRLALERFTELAKQDAGANIEISSHFMDGDEKKGRELLAAIQARKPNLIFAVGTGAALLAHEGIKDIPIVYSMVLNPHTYPLKGKNVCGISLDISPKEQLEFLKRVKPDIKKVGVIYNPTTSENLIDEAYSFARANQFDLIRKRAESIKEAITVIWLCPSLS